MPLLHTDLKKDKISWIQVKRNTDTQLLIENPPPDSISIFKNTQLYRNE
jgi:hypothetical protein